MNEITTEIDTNMVPPVVTPVVETEAGVLPASVPTATKQPRAPRFPRLGSGAALREAEARDADEAREEQEFAKDREDARRPVEDEEEPDDPRLRLVPAAEDIEPLAVLESAMAADKQALADQIAALRASYADEIKAAEATILACAEVRRDFDPLRERVARFLSSSTWQRLAASAHEPTRQRAYTLDHLTEQTRMLLQSTVTTLRELIAEARALDAAALDPLNNQGRPKRLREEMRMQLGHADEAKRRIVEIRAMVESLARYVEKNPATAPEIRAWIVSPETQDMRERGRPFSMPARADGDFNPLEA